MPLFVLPLAAVGSERSFADRSVRATQSKSFDSHLVAALLRASLRMTKEGGWLPRGPNEVCDGMIRERIIPSSSYREHRFGTAEGC